MNPGKIFSYAFRMIKAYRLYSVINIIGLSLGLACFLLLTMHIHRELTADKFHTNYDKIYTVVSQLEGQNQWKIGTLRPSFATGIDPDATPEIIAFTSISVFPGTEISPDNTIKYNALFCQIDSNFLNIFDFPVNGINKNHPFNDPNAVLITEELANKVFGDKNPLEKTLFIAGQPFAVKGILNTTPGKSSLQFDLLALSCPEKAGAYYNSETQFALIESPQKAEILNQKMNQFVHSNQYKIPLKVFERFVPFSDLYKNENKELFVNDPMIRQGNPTNTRILGIVAVIILIIGLFNFVNIYTVTLLRRGKEFSVQKVFGAGSGVISLQFIAENLIMIATATGLAFGLIELFRPLIETSLGIEVVYQPRFDIPVVLGILCLLPLITIVVPVLKYRYASTVRTMKQTGNSGKTGISRSTFIVAQYIMTIVLIVMSLFFMWQLKYMLNADNGYRTRNIISTPLWPEQYGKIFGRQGTYFADFSEDVTIRQQYIQNQLESAPFIENWSIGNTIVQEGKKNIYPIKFKYKNGEYHEVYNIQLNDNQEYLKVFGIKTVQGDSPETPSEGNELLINETAARLFGVADINDEGLISERAVNQDKGNRLYKITGIVKDFHTGHLSKATPPLIFLHSYGNANVNLVVHFREGYEKETIALLKKLHEETHREGEFTYTVVEDEVKALYEGDRQVATVYGVFAVIAIFISSLGLFSLSVYDVQQRRREIALRKVNGATTGEVIALLSAKYYKLLLIAYAVAIPVAWFAISRYLEGFDTKAPLRWWIFATAALVTALISLLTLWWQTLRAARENPATAMKSE